MKNGIKRLSGAIAMLAALGGLIGFLSGNPSPPEAIAAAEGAAPAHQPNPAWTAPDQEAAKKRAQEIVPFVEAVLEECQLCRQMRLRETGLGIKDITNSYFLLDSPIIKKSEDLYGPVRFKHSKHAAQLKDCALCHHRRPIDASAKETTRCSACHQEAFRSDQPERLGLKAAFHQQCTGCHQDNRDIDFKKIAHKGTDFSFMASKGRDVSHLIGTTDYIDFKALGYKGDPIIHGGRFKKLPMGYKPQ